MSTGLAIAASRGRNWRRRAWASSGRTGISSPSASQTSAQRTAGPPEFVMMPPRRPRGGGWGGRGEAWTKSFPREGAGGGGPRRRARGRAAALQGGDRLPPPDPAREPRKLPRVAEGLDVEKDHVGPRVRPPVGEEIVAGDVGPVPDGA